MPKVSIESLSLDMIDVFPEHWKEMILSDVCIQVTDGTHDSPKEVVVGFPLVTGKSIKNRRIDFSKAYNISEEDHLKVVARSKAERDDILFANIGNSIGDLVRVQSDLNFSIKNVALFKPNKEIINPRFLEYYFFSNKVQAFIKNSTKGSAQPFIGLASLRGFPVAVPSKEEQNYIAKILGDIDDKIELNRQTNQTLEHIAQALFKCWFVDFEPTRAKIIAKEKGANTAIQELAAQAIICGAMTLEQLEAITQNLETTLQQAINEKLNQTNQTPNNTEQLKTTAALFPNELVDSELGEIPEGWEAQTLEDVIELAYGKALKKTVRVEGDFPVYGSGGLTGTHNDALVEGPGVIVGRKGTVGSLYWEDSSFYPIDTVFYVKPKSSITLVYAYSLLQTLGLADMNTDAAVPGLNRNNVYRLDVVKPPEKLILIFSKLIGSFRERLSLNKQESKSLVEVRDLLLPKLLSGDLPI